MPSASCTSPAAATFIKMPVIGGNNGGNGAYRGGGFDVCCCRLFTCVNVSFLTGRLGVLKLGQVLLGMFCQWVLFEFGQPYAADIGQAYVGFVTTVAASLTTATLLLASYTVSPRTQQLVRQSLFVSDLLFTKKKTTAAII